MNLLLNCPSALCLLPSAFFNLQEVVNITEKIKIRVPPGSRIFSDRLAIPQKELARREAEDEVFAQRCREIFWQVYPELVKEHYLK